MRKKLPYCYIDEKKHAHCLSCRRKIAIKPGPFCNESKHIDYYQRVLKRSKEWMKTAKGRRYQKDLNLRKSIGITLAEVAEMLQKQNDSCAICSKPLSLDHITKMLRGVLCKRCNSAIGFLEDSTELCSRRPCILQVFVFPR